MSVKLQVAAGRSVEVTKSLVRDLGNLNGLHDITSMVAERPNLPTLISQIVNPVSQFLQTNTFEHDYTVYTQAMPSDKPYAERGVVVDARPVTKTHLHKVPSFGVQAHIRPSDVLRRRKAGTADLLETMEAVVAEDMGSVGRGWDLFTEKALAHAITTGTLYVPNGTVASVDFYQEYTSAARPVVNYVLSTTTVHPRQYGEEARRRILDNLLEGQQVDGFIALCGVNFFNDLMSHPKWEQAMIDRSGLNGQDPLIKRFENFSQQYRMFRGADDILYIEYAGQIGGSALIPTNEAYIMPVGAQGIFTEVFAPAETMGYVNTVAQREYMWRVDSEFDGVKLYSESNKGLYCVNPLLIQKCTKS